MGQGEREGGRGGIVGRGQGLSSWGQYVVREGGSALATNTAGTHSTCSRIVESQPQSCNAHKHTHLDSNKKYISSVAWLSEALCGIPPLLHRNSLSRRHMH